MIIDRYARPANLSEPIVSDPILQELTGFSTILICSLSPGRISPNRRPRSLRSLLCVVSVG
jgi:hypothetical protein